MDDKLWAEFGKSCAELEIATNRHNEIKKKVAMMLSKQKEEQKAE